MVFKYILRNNCPMVNLTVSLPKETVDQLRKVVRERYGGKKGAISGLVRAALEEHLSETARGPPSVFGAYDDGRKVAEAASLDELTSKLEKLGVDPRTMRILSSTPLRQVVRAGLRGSRA